ncbi:MAG: hypothetical protein HRU01_26620 [Myxococcales bacterium]|nr:hypothetical protein [Myxococcales bacterium]
MQRARSLLSDQHDVVEQRARASARHHHGLCIGDGQLIGIQAPELLRATDDLLQHLDYPAMTERHESAVRAHGKLSAHPNAPVHDEVTPLALCAETKRLELANDLERERVVELAHVDIRRLQTGLLEADASGALADEPVLVPNGRRHVGHALAIEGSPEDGDGLELQIRCALPGGHEHGATALGVHRAVEKMKGVGDHARIEDVLRRHLPPVEHGLRVSRAVAADRRCHLGELLGAGAVQRHVSLGDQCELGGRIQPPALDKLVGGTRPRRRRRTIGVHACLAACDDDGVALAGGDRSRRLHDRGDAHLAVSRPAGAAA